MNVACILIEHLPINAERQRNPSLSGRPVILAPSNGSKQPVVDFSLEAGELDIGMPVRETISRCKDALVLEPDVPHYQQVFKQILDALELRSPIVEDAGLGTSYVDIRGLETLYRGSEGVAKALLEAVPSIYEPRLGIAHSKFPAYVAAMSAPPGRAMTVSEDVEGMLALFSVDVLPVSWKTKEALKMFGLRSLGQITALPVGPLQAQFGVEGRLTWRLAKGIDDRPVIPRPSEETITQELPFPEPTVSMDALLMGVETLLRRAFSQGRRSTVYARGVSLQAHIYHRRPWVKRISFNEPIADQKRILTIVRDTIVRLFLPGPVEEMTLTLWGLTGEAGTQSSFFTDVRKQQNLRNSLLQLRAQMGGILPVYQYKEMEPWSRIPERQWALVPYL